MVSPDDVGPAFSLFDVVELRAAGSPEGLRYVVTQVRRHEDVGYVYEISCLIDQPEDADWGGLYAEADLVGTGARNEDLTRYVWPGPFRHRSIVRVSSAHPTLGGQEGVVDARLEGPPGIAFVDFEDESAEIEVRWLEATDRIAPPIKSDLGEGRAMLDDVEWRL